MDLSGNMRLAIKQARIGLCKGNKGFGAVIVKIPISLHGRLPRGKKKFTIYALNKGGGGTSEGRLGTLAYFQVKVEPIVAALNKGV